jgi:Tfp pilus assembly protein PilF
MAIAAGVARLLGDRPFLMTFGVGPRLSVRVYRTTIVIVKAIPFAPSIGIASPRERGQWLRLSLELLVPTLAVGAAYYWVFTCPSRSPVLRGFGVGPAWSSSFLIAGAGILYISSFVALGALTRIPGLSNINRETLKSWRSMATTQAATHLMRQQRHAEAERVLRLGLADDPENLLLNLDLAATLGTQGDYAGSLATLEPLLAREMPAALQALARNLWAWTCYMLQDNARLDSADEASRLALEHATDNDHYLDTRGHVLLWAGKPAEAESHLLRAHDVAKVDSTRGFAAAGLAMACYRQNRIDDAKAWLARAKEHCPNEKLVARAVAEVEPLSR